MHNLILSMPQVTPHRRRHLSISKLQQTVRTSRKHRTGCNTQLSDPMSTERKRMRNHTHGPTHGPKVCKIWFADRVRQSDQIDRVTIRKCLKDPQTGNASATVRWPRKVSAYEEDGVRFQFWMSSGCSPTSAKSTAGSSANTQLPRRPPADSVKAAVPKNATSIADVATARSR